MLITDMLRRAWKQKTERRRALLGDGQGTVDVAGQSGRVWVRMERGVDANGLTVYGGKTIVKAGVSAAYIRGDNVGVIVGRDFFGELAIESMDAKWMETTGINPAITNHLTPELQYITLQQISLLLSRPTGLGTTSPYVNVYPLLYMTDDYQLQIWQGTTQSTQIDLTVYLPTSGNHLVAVLALNTFTNTIDIETSTAQAITSPLGVADVQEALDLHDDGIVPIQAYRLASDSSSVTAENLFLDLRQIINMPRLFGFPNPITRRVRIKAGRQVVVYNGITVNSGGLINDGEIVVI